MSQKAVIDYQGISIQAQARCDTVIRSLEAIDRTLNHIHKTASKLETGKVKEYENYLLESKNTIKEKIRALNEELEQYKNKRAYSSYAERAEYTEFLNFENRIQRESRELMQAATDLTGSKLAVIDQMISEELLIASQESAQQLRNRINGTSTINSDMLQKVNDIDDIAFRELAYRELINDANKDLDYENIISKAREAYDLLLNKRTAQVIQEYKEELKSNGVSSEALDKIDNIDEANKIVSESITDEKIRKETLKIIIKAIRDRGFIVDTKNNVKINKEKNIVKLVALKASGQRAEFEVSLNGKFMYHFDEYEGQACKKDIQPFFDDLQSIYGINVLHEEIIWKNPDKIQTQKYQSVNTRKGTN